MLTRYLRLATADRGPQSAPGPKGPPGEVALQQLADALATTSANINTVATLGMAVPSPATLEDLANCISTIAAKLDEVIMALRR